MTAKKKVLRPNQEGMCPSCGKYGDLDYSAMVNYDGGVYYPYVCKCGFDGREYYMLKFDSHTDEEGFEPNEENFNRRPK
jgi:hypothetical protein